MTAKGIKSIANEKVLGHPAGLFLLFFTEMWERFSYYGMRALLVLFLISAAGIGGWEWSNEEALSLYALYTGLVYITPIFGGLIADKLTGYRNAITIGALLMTAGHASMAFETEFTFYLGLGLLILGNGMFKPNISSIVGGLYKDEKKKDSGYTIFYMGINAGAFLGIMLCGYVGEKVGWSYGFGLAGIFMFLGMLMFYFGQGIFGELGKKPEKITTPDEEHLSNDPGEIFDANEEGLDREDEEKPTPKVERDRLTVIGILAFFTIFFWMAFEQAGGSMTIFAADFTERVISGGAATAFVAVDTIITIVPLAVITYVLILLIRATMKRNRIANMCIGLSFLIIWGIAIWKIVKYFNTVAYEVSFMAEHSEAPYQVTIDEDGEKKTVKVRTDAGKEPGSVLFIQEDEDEKDKYNVVKPKHKATAVSQLVDSVMTKKGVEPEISKNVNSGIYDLLSDKKPEKDVRIQATVERQLLDTIVVRTDAPIESGQDISILDVDKEGKFWYLDEETAGKVELKEQASVIRAKDKEVEVPASWFGVLNSLFIILFAPVFSKIWESRFNPTAPVKFAFGLILLGLGFAALAFGSGAIEQGATSAEVSMIWLILAYLLHTLGELSLSPVGLSYVSKLSPTRLVGLMFGVWFGATAIANYIAGWTGSYIDQISDEYGLQTFFLIYTAIPIAAGLILVLLNKWLLKKMHGIR